MPAIVAASYVTPSADGVCAMISSKSVGLPTRAGQTVNCFSIHSAIMDAVYDLLQTTSVRDLTMDQIAKRAGVGKPTLYKCRRHDALASRLRNQRYDGPNPIRSSLHLWEKTPH
jgi:hypothetical protein